MRDDTPEPDNIIPFPPQLRVVPIEPAPAQPLEHSLALIEHDGRLYDLAALVRHLSPAELQVIAAAGPRQVRRCGITWCGAGRRWRRRSWRVRGRRGEVGRRRRSDSGA